MSMIDGDSLVDALYRNKANLDKGAQEAGFVGGIHIGPFGIPNQFLGLDLRTDGQRKAQEAPGQYLAAMTDFFRTLSAALDKAYEAPRN